jgi:hypothetical protein
MTQRGPGRRLQLSLVEQRLQRHASPFADTTPAFDAVMPRDLRARRHGAQLGQGRLKWLSDKTADHQLPIRKSIRGIATLCDIT